jgi:hypothetical protein
MAGKGKCADFRRNNERPIFIASWYNGAPGILISRHVVYSDGLTDLALEYEVAAAPSSTFAHHYWALLGLSSELPCNSLATGHPLPV